MCGQCIEINTTFTLLQSQAYEQDDNDSLFSYLELIYSAAQPKNTYVPKLSFLSAL